MVRRTVRRKPRAQSGPGKRSTAPRKRVKKMTRSRTATGSTRGAGLRATAKRKPAARTTSKRVAAAKMVAPKVLPNQAMPSAAPAAAEPSGVVSVSHEPLERPSLQDPDGPVSQEPLGGAQSVEVDEDLALDDGEPV